MNPHLRTMGLMAGRYQSIAKERTADLREAKWELENILDERYGTRLRRVEELTIAAKGAYEMARYYLCRHLQIPVVDD